MADKNYIKANSNNLPSVDSFMVYSFVTTSDKFVAAELKGVKNARAGRDTYGDDAIGYVQIQRSDKEITKIKARVTPEHRVRSKGYVVLVLVDEQEEKIVSAECLDCAASMGGCKHSIAFLMWLHRRSEEPSPTSVSCYWKKSKLSAVGTSLKFVKAEDLGRSRRGIQDGHEDPDNTFLQAVVDAGAGSQSQLLKHFRDVEEYEYLSLNYLAFLFRENGGGTIDEFSKFCDFHMTKSRCSFVEGATVFQSNCSMWHNLRFARVTASKIYEASRCQTYDGSLFESIMGAKICDTPAMKRGRDLEPQVIKTVEEMLGTKFTSIGLVLNAGVPFLGASPDAINDKFVVEVKCPSSEKTISSYLSKGSLTSKCLGQIQLQMHLTGRKVGLFCVAQPDFEVSKKVEVVTVQYNRTYVEKLINSAMLFWEKSIFPKLTKT